MKRTSLAGALALAAVTAAVLVPASATAGTASLDVVPYDMDASNLAGWWTPLETYVGATENTYMAFNTPAGTGTHHVSVAERITSSGVVTWAEHRLLDGGVPAEFDNDLGHAQPSVARDGNGELHVFAGMHTDPWKYYRSNGLGDLENESAEMPDQDTKVTYPVLATAPNGDVYLAARVDRLDSAGNVVSRPGRLYQWDVSSQQWNSVGIFAEESGKAVYPDDIQVDASGNVHLVYSWSRFPSSGYRHALSYIVYKPGTSTFEDSGGATMTLPTTPSTSDVIQTLSGTEDYAVDDLGVQTAKLALDGADPKVAYRYRSPDSGSIFEVRFAENTGSSWLSDIVHSGTQTRATVDVTWHPTEGARVYYVVNSGTDRAFVATDTGAAWASHSVADGLPIERIAVERSAANKDILYLVDLTNGDLIYGRH
jgi:hypothetical protein